MKKYLREMKVGEICVISESPHMYFKPGTKVLRVGMEVYAVPSFHNAYDITHSSLQNITVSHYTSLQKLLGLGKT